jgi:hypothetical protein
MRAFGLTCVALALGVAGCRGGLPRPSSGPVPVDSMIEVPYPPPPARVEEVPAQKAAGDVWIDGQWDWDGRMWRWIPGAWVTPRKGAYFTNWTTRRERDGSLHFARATWRDATGRALDEGFGNQVCPVAQRSAAR